MSGRGRDPSSSASLNGRCRRGASIRMSGFRASRTIRRCATTKSRPSRSGSTPARRWATPPTCRSLANSTMPTGGTSASPDVIVTSPKHVVPAEAADWWGSYYVETGLTEDRYIKAIESKPGKTAVVHHLLTYAVDADMTGDSNGDDSNPEASGEFLNEFAVGKNGDLFPEGTGRLLRAGSKIKFDFHYHSVGQEITDQSQLGIVLYPKGYTPKHIVYSKQLGQPTEPLDIPGGSTYVRSDGYTRF